MAQRISRAKRTVSGVRFNQPGDVGTVLRVLYLVFNEGYSGDVDLAAEAIRLTRQLAARIGHEEVAGLLALMLLHHARRPARTGPDGRLVPLAEQDRSRWDRTAIAEGQALLTRTLGAGPVGPYQIQAAIAAVHDEAADDEQTDWPQILALYDVLAQIAPGPMVTLSRAVAMARVHGPRAGLALLGTLDADERMAHTHRLEAVRAHLLEQAGDPHAARASYLRAARMTASLPEQRYLIRRAALLRNRH
jgi:predicted RNA polymerase sigma factor